MALIQFQSPTFFVHGITQGDCYEQVAQRQLWRRRPIYPLHRPNGLPNYPPPEEEDCEGWKPPPTGAIVLLWGTPTLYAGGGGDASFLPSEAPGETYLASASIALPTPYSAHASNTGTLLYIAPATPASLHIDVNKQSNLEPGAVDLQHLVLLKDWNANTILEVVIPWDEAGAFEFPFTFPDTEGEIREVTLYAAVGATAPFWQPNAIASITASGYLHLT